MEAAGGGRLRESSRDEVLELARQSSGGDGGGSGLAEGTMLDSVWENQRKLVVGEYAGTNLMESDRAAWTDAAGEPLQIPGRDPRAPGARHPAELLELSRAGGVPWAPSSEGEGWSWRSEWVVDAKPGATDDEGWRYAPRFNPAQMGWSAEPSRIRFVRRRRWLRLRARSVAGGGAGARSEQQRSSAEDVRALAPAIFSPRAPGSAELLDKTPQQLAEMAAELPAVVPERASVLADAPSTHPGVLAVRQAEEVDVLAKDVDPSGQFWLVRHEGVFGFVPRELLRVLDLWGAAPPTSSAYTWGRNNHFQLGHQQGRDEVLEVPQSSKWQLPPGHVLTQVACGRDYSVAVTVRPTTALVSSPLSPRDSDRLTIVARGGRRTGRRRHGSRRCGPGAPTSRGSCRSRRRMTSAARARSPR